MRVSFPPFSIVTLLYNFFIQSAWLLYIALIEYIFYTTAWQKISVAWTLIFDKLNTFFNSIRPLLVLAASRPLSLA